MSGSNFDDSCLKDVYDEHLSEDYVSIPSATVVDGANVQRHNLFCGSSLNGKSLQCKSRKMSMKKKSMSCIYLIFFLVHTTGPIVIQVNTDNKTFDGTETGFRFRYRFKNH